ncbi:2-dehydropantoate 2-reductase N-terminal domain-containing protein [Sodalis praecaptivus]|uniref:2-dehydropantoate 2-reductase N-terminal domain-containing protein n=1 Tax=Sodalis praecaptivus TaxID=1239307 RepID=UPI00280BFE19|nr:2-dehydropantoate 2-reductase N-terminal domain-containing protein [Sodalis praecaptivus]
MRILVVGAGATGGYFGGRLAEAGRDVTFLVRRTRAQTLRQHGLQIISPCGDVVLRPALVEAGDLADHYDVILLTVKAFSLAAAMEDIAPAVGPETAIVHLLNGMGHLARLRERFGAEAVMGGVCKIAATLDAQGALCILPRRTSYFTANWTIAAPRGWRVSMRHCATPFLTPAPCRRSPPRCGKSGYYFRAWAALLA